MIWEILPSFVAQILTTYAYIDNCGFSALVQQEFPGMSLHLVVHCEYSHILIFTTGCWVCFSVVSYLGSHSSGMDFTTLSSTSIVNAIKLLFQVDACNKIGSVSFHPFHRCCHCFFCG